MALRFIEGFDHYSAFDDIDSHAFWSLVGTTSISLVTGRDGAGQAIRFINDGRYLTCTFGGTEATIVVGFAFKVDATSFGEEILDFYGGGTLQLRLQVLVDGTLRLLRGSATIIETTGTSPVSDAAWHYLEAKVTIDDTAGAYEFWVDGNSVMSDTVVDTQAGGSAQVDQIRLSGMDSKVEFDDLYILDTTGSAPNNDRLGDCKVETLYPTVEGQTNDWTPSTGVDNAALVDDPQNDAEYVTSSTVNHDDLYAFDNSSANADTIFGLLVTARGDKDDTGARSIALRTTKDPTGTPVQQTGSNIGLVNGSFNYHHELFETYDGSNAWDKTTVDGAEIGIKLTV